MAVTIDVVGSDRKVTLELPEPKEAVLHEVVAWQLAKRRRGTAATATEVIRHLRPITEATRRRIEEEGDDLPIEWLHRDDRYGEKLATPARMPRVVLNSTSARPSRRLRRMTWISKSPGRTTLRLRCSRRFRPRVTSPHGKCRGTTPRGTSYGEELSRCRKTASQPSSALKNGNSAPVAANARPRLTVAPE